MAGPAISLADALPKGMLKPPLRLEELQDKTIEVLSMLNVEGDLGNYARFTIRYKKEVRTFQTGSSMIMERLGAAQDQFPVICTVRKVGRAWLVE